MNTTTGSLTTLSLWNNVDRSNFLPAVEAVRPPILSLFCGPGGLDEGFWQAGFRTELAGDIDTSAVETHAWNHAIRGTFTAQMDVSNITVDELIGLWRQQTDASPVGIIGGPPCQSFSNSNAYKKDDDPRHTLPGHYARLIDGVNQEFGIDFFLFENVPGLLSEKHLKYYEGFKEMCRSSGFDVSENLINAVHFGVPQYRERLIIVGINKAKHPNAVLNYPVGLLDEVPARDVIGNLPEPVYWTRGLKSADTAFHPNHWCMMPKSAKFFDGTIKPGEVKGRCFRALSWDKPSWTVAYGHREVHVHPGCHRRLSIYEAMRLQGFPETYQLKGTLSNQITQVSDAVPPPVAKAMAVSIGECLSYSLGDVTVQSHILR